MDGGQKAKEQEDAFFFSISRLLHRSLTALVIACPTLEASLASTSTTQDPTSFSTVKQRDTRTKKGETDLL